MAPPFVVSVSYGQDEASVTAAYAQRQCAEYAKLGMMGTTVLYSSGDDGVAGNGGDCLDTRGSHFSSYIFEASGLSVASQAMLLVVGLDSTQVSQLPVVF